MLTVADAARHACVCESMIRQWIRDGTLPHYRLGALGKRGKIVIAVEDLDGVLANFKVSGLASKPAPKPATTVKLRHLRLPS